MLKKNLPNLFDQYSQYENRVTNALLQTLAVSPGLLRSFLREFLEIHSVGVKEKIVISSQKKPGEKGDQAGNPGVEEERGTVPDAWISAEEGEWAVVLESKIHPNAVREDQLRGHLRELVRQVGKDAKKYMLVLSPDESEPRPVRRLKGPTARVLWRPWKDVHEWVARNARGSKSAQDIRAYLLRSLREYMEMDETLSGFQGIDFSEGFDSVRAKVVLKALMGEIEPTVETVYPELTERRGKIGTGPPVWDIFGVEPFTSDLHFTFALRTDMAAIHLTVPNSAGSRWKRLKRILRDRVMRQEFERLLMKTRTRMPELWIWLHHRHFQGRTKGIFDARFELNLDTANFIPPKKRVRQFPFWFEGAAEAICLKRKINLEMGFEVRFPYDRYPKLKRPEFAETAFETLKNFRELYQFLRR